MGTRNMFLLLLVYEGDKYLSVVEIYCMNADLAVQFRESHDILIDCPTITPALPSLSASSTCRFLTSGTSL